MKPKISLVTLGVRDLERARRFYRDGLGLPPHGEDNPDIAFFELQGTWLSLFPRDKLAEDATVPDDGQPGFIGITLAHNVASVEAVDATLDEAVRAGARLVKPAERAHWGGYSGYFADPDGFLWEVAYNPYTDLT